MAIADTITSMYDNVGNAYNVLTLAGADLTNVNKNLVNLTPTWKERLLYFINNGTDVVWENWDKVVGEGTSLTLNNTLEAKMKIELKGNTEQTQYTGKNKWSLSSHFENNTSTNRWVQTDTTLIVPAGTYTLSYTLSSGGGGVLNYKYSDNTDHLTTLTVNKVTITFTDEVKKVALQLYANTTITNIQLETGSSATSYEPYVGGIPSPSPSYPQPIQVVSGDNEIVVTGKNMFDDSVITNIWSNYSTQQIVSSNGSNLHRYECKQGDTFTLSATFDSASGNGAILIQFFDKEGNSLGRNASSLNTTLTLTKTAPANTSYAYIGRYLMPPTTIQLEKGSTATDYEPYKEQSYEINLGKNLLNNILTTQTLNGVTATKNDDGSVTLNGTATAQTDFSFLNTKLELKDGTYTFSISDVGDSNVRIQYGVSGYGIMDTGTATTSYTTTFPNSSVGTSFSYINMFRIRIVNGATLNNYTVYPMIEKGSKATPYSKYFEPLELCKIGNYQDSIKKSTGKNLFDKDNLTIEMGTISAVGDFGYSTERVRAYWVEVKENTQYTISTSNSDLQIVPYYYNSSKTFISFDSGWKNFPFTFTTPANTKYVAFLFKNSTNNPTPSSLTEIMLNEGSTALPYEPYGTDWYLKKEIGKVVLDGSNDEIWTRSGATTENSFVGAFNLIATGISNKWATGSTWHCDKFIYGSLGADYKFNTYNGDATQGYIFFGITIPTSLASDINSFRTWLGNNNVTLYYVLATPTYTKIEGTLQSQLNALSNAKSYNSQTNISQENNDLPFELDVVALGVM